MKIISEESRRWIWRIILFKNNVAMIKSYHLKILSDIKNRLRSYEIHLIWNSVGRDRGNEEH